MTALAPSSSPVQVSVAPTTTTVLVLDVRYVEQVAVQVTNLDGTQTFDGIVERKTFQETAYAPSTMPDFQGLAPGASVMADIDCRGSAYLRLVGTMSGAGGNVRVSYTRRAAR